MNKTVLFILLIALAFGCGKDKSSNNIQTEQVFLSPYPNGQVVSSTVPTFRWQSSLNSDSTNYTLILKNNTTDSVSEFHLSEPVLELTNNLPKQTAFSWQVIAEEKGKKWESPAWSFKTEDTTQREEISQEGLAVPTENNKQIVPINKLERSETGIAVVVPKQALDSLELEINDTEMEDKLWRWNDSVLEISFFDSVYTFRLKSPTTLYEYISNREETNQAVKIVEPLGLISPADRAEVEKEFVELLWENSEEVAFYKLNLIKENDSDTLYFFSTSARYIPENIKPESNYSWQVSGFDEDSTQLSKSDWASFYVVKEDQFREQRIREKEVLLTLFEQLDGDSWNVAWDTVKPVQTWYGLSFNSKGLITKIALQTNNMRGELNLKLEDTDLSELMEFNVSENLISHLDHSWFNRPNLRTLNLSSNLIEGSLEIGAPRLIAVDLSVNKIEQIDWTADLPIKTLRLAENKLTWETVDLESLTQLEVLDLSNNQIETDFRNIQERVFALREVNLSGNKLNGKIELDHRVKTVRLDLSNNQLEGNLSSLWKNAKAIQYLNLKNNKLEGGFPKKEFNMPALKYLNLSNNKLSENWQMITKALSLEELRLSQNRLSGFIPKEIKNLTQLKKLDLSSNQLTSGIHYLVQMTRLEELTVSHNILSVVFPIDIPKESSLEIFDIQDNNVSGEVPAEFFQIEMLNKIDLRDNPKLRGSLPPLICEEDTDIEVKIEETQIMDCP